jgi:signal transduction histidine kinase
MKLRLSHLWPADLRGQIAGILFLGLALSQLISMGLYAVLLPKWQQVLRPESLIVRMDMAVRLLESSTPARRSEYAKLLGDDREFRLSYEPQRALVDAGDTLQSDDQDLRRALAMKLNKPIEDVWVTRGSPLASASKRVEVELNGGGALLALTRVGLEHRLGLVEQVGSVAFVLFAIGGVWMWLTWTVNAPLSRVARGAESIGLDVHSPPIAEQGPAQLQRLSRAFNDMQHRLARMLSDRSLMLGTISHDLRTPLTRLRLRVETDRAQQDKAKMLEDIESMEQMLNSALSYLRGVDDPEAHEEVDLATLLQTACDTVTDLGGDAEYVGPSRGRYRCKPHAMMRAMTNVIANAARYGGSANVRLVKPASSGYVVEVEDRGPGIPDAEKNKVFEPFYRTSTGQTLNNQGMGLGLSIARSIVIGHGGTIELLDAIPRGLLVRIGLPQPSVQG